MDALDSSDQLIRRGNELRARSVRMCAAADEKLDKSRRLIAAAAKARQAVLRAYGWEPPSDPVRRCASSSGRCGR